MLHDLLLCFSLPPFTRRAQRKLTTHRKLYWFDTGVFLAARPSGPMDAAREIGGAALEGLVAQHLRAWIDYGQHDLQLCFWRTQSHSEVDFVAYGRAGFFAIEVKAGERVRREDLRSLRSFGEDYPEARRLLLHRGSKHFEIDGIQCSPVDAFLRALHPARELPFAR